MLPLILRRKKRGRRSGGAAKFEAISIADIAFLLLIFFIVTGSFILRQGVFFSLPSETAASIKIDEKEMIDIYPLNSGYRFQGRDVGRETVYEALRVLRKENGNIILIIRMASDVKYERLVDALSIARETGIKRVSLKNAEGDL